MKGNKILVSNDPKGRHESVVISGTPLPGTHMELVPATNANAAGLFTYRALTRADGTKGPICILLEDDEQGKIATDAYVSGKVGKVYWPAAGEFMNVLLRDQPGTGTAGINDVGDVLAVDGATGYLTPVGALNCGPWQLMEDLTEDVSAAQLAFCQYRGDQA